jgi:hypothetical protein
MDAPQLRTEVRNLLLAFDRSFAPSELRGADVKRHTFRLRFALARVEEQAQAAVMESALYTPSRYDVALSILRTDIERARAFLAANTTVAGTSAVELREPGELAQRAA